MLSRQSQPKTLRTISVHLHNIFEMTKFQRQRTDLRSPRMALKGSVRIQASPWCQHLLYLDFTGRLTAAAAAKSLQSCPTVRPHRQQPTRLRHPWDSPGKNTGVGCHCLLRVASHTYTCNKSRGIIYLHMHRHTHKGLQVKWGNRHKTRLLSTPG